MSRKRRDRGDNPDNVLDELGSIESESPFGGLGDTSTASGFADAGYGSSIGHDDPFAKLGRNREKIHLTQIDSIVPNPSQPRRAIPSSVRQYWAGLSDEDTMAHFFQKWLEEVNLERGTNSSGFFPLDDYLAGEPTPRTQGIDHEDQLDQITDERMGPKEIALLRVVDLATSIRRDGLINPISIAQKDRLWEIETGERRWLAYQLLNWRLGGDDWQKIPARQVDGVSIWRQSTENNTRTDLNAIAKARQFALLLMDILSDDAPFEAFSSFEHEQAYYAQVSDGNMYRVPRSRGEDILNAMGLENPVQLRQYRSLLRLPQPVWEWADDLNWTESFIRKELQAKATNEDDMIRLGVRQALADGYTVSSVTAWEHLLEQDTAPKAQKTNFTFSEMQGSTLTKLESQYSKLGKSDKKKAIEYLEGLLASFRDNL